jgi:AGCS family alanine or glycine:cation symporter
MMARPPPAFPGDGLSPRPEDGFLPSVGAALAQAVFRASDLLYGPWRIRPGVEIPVFAVLLFAVAILVTLRLRFVQVARFRDAVRSFVPAASEGGGALSPFQAFMTALAATIGVGNIAGVATAVVSGGPGAVFWIWCYGFFATAVKFSEAVLGMRFRRLGGGRLSAGPMHYLRDGLGRRRLGWVYALLAGLAALTTTPFTQPNSIAVVLHSQFRVPALATGVVVAVLTWLVIVGGLRSIGRAAEKLSPAKVVLYLAGGLLVILLHVDRLPATLALVFREAFSLRAGLGSAAGLGMMMAMRYGLARGMYANEAGYGTAAFVYGTARSQRPVRQGLAAVMEVFIISFLTSSISALSILVTGVWRSGLTSTAAVAEAFNHAVPVAGGWVVAFCTFLFGYTTLIGWSYYGEVCLEFILGPRVIRPYRWVYCGLIVLGATSRVDLVWAWGDLMNGLQVFPNLVGVVGLSGVVARLLREDGARRGGEDGGGAQA